MPSPKPNPQCPMPNDGSYSTWGDPKTVLPPQCPIPKRRINHGLQNSY
ncbi:MAG: hypothetical protein V7K98_22450 [Nostoc sp.]